MREFWNQKFADAGYKYGEQPNVFLAEQAGRIPTGAKVLVPGDGEGRNGVWLAQQGHLVTSVDCSDVGLSKARALAERRGVHIDTIQADLTVWVPPSQSFDAVVLVYVHLPSAVRGGIHQGLIRALKPGGLLILEAFHPSQIGLSSGGPKDVDMLYTEQALRDDARLSGETGESLLAWEGRVTLNEGPYHQGPAQVTRWMWRKAG